MSLSQDFRDAGRVKALLAAIARTAGPVAARLGRPLQIMEVCGGHTHAIFRFGLHQLLPDAIEFIHGPGCPVCVLPVEAVDQAVDLARRENVILASFGDPLRVPGSRGSLLQARAEGAEVRVLYSPFDALALAQDNPHKQVVFFAIGFDTTMPSIACSLQAADKAGLTNLRFLCHHIRLMPTLIGLLEAGEVRLDGFVGPGHVSMVIGSRVYQPIASHYHKPLVIAGFEPVDFLQALYQLVLQLAEGRCAIENAYGRVVAAEGNPAALKVIEEVFESNVDSRWRGLGTVPGSGVRVREHYRHLDASTSLASLPQIKAAAEPAWCNAVLTGRIKPHQCPLFRRHCTPEHPVGALMVSSEGACAAYYQYRPEQYHPEQDEHKETRRDP
ncbi:hydrogenase expression/formation protein HypD [Oceanisphaera litoralis]|uniref:hydrogenase formation protein HypD n=1 Tax=Oceanisphaera litoralis TaxID=225144 RepID=UPI0019572E8E|nr:hydrogenase formation protein HypD [Oceanisphaera litoralis]MBM7457105.1 hydrogenase expression/formation protein HypD [Oceanisphaera litoralis]